MDVAVEVENSAHLSSGSISAPVVNGVSYIVLVNTTGEDAGLHVNNVYILLHSSKYLFFDNFRLTLPLYPVASSPNRFS